MWTRVYSKNREERWRRNNLSALWLEPVYHSMKYHEQYEAFKKLAIQQGICRLEQFNEALPFGSTVPIVRVEKWLRRILDIPSGFSEQRRYVNRFKLGADPEFIFHNGESRVDARNLDLAQGLAFGMDNNGRLTELRPYPSRSALRVTASLLATLRWLALIHPKTLDYDWCSGAFLCGDGLGGHVHFGRKRPSRELEVKALDVIEDELLAIKAYPLAEVMRRRQGNDNGHNHPYGLPGDIRHQMHGYEYRTFPSWLDSPELAFLTITLSKLVVHNPGLAQGYGVLNSMDRHYQRVKNLLAYYKDIDDDARLALMLVSKKFPVHAGGDFKKRWGIPNLVPEGAPKVKFVPSSIKPDSTDVLEMFDYLQGKGPLVFRIPTPTWGPLVPIPTYKMVISDVATYGAKGLGELLWDIVTHESQPYAFVNAREPGTKYFSIPFKLANQLPKNWHNITDHKIGTHEGNEKWIYSYEPNRQGPKFSECRQLLLGTIFPFWRIGEVKPDSILQWKKGLCEKPRDQFTTITLFGDLGQLPRLR